MNVNDFTKEQSEALRLYRYTLWKMMGKNSFELAMEEAAQRAMDNFGLADTFYASPAQLKEYKGLMAQIEDSK